MKLLTYADARGARIAVLAENEGRNRFIDIADTDPDLPSEMRSLLALGQSVSERRRVADKLSHIQATGFGFAPDTVQLLPPVPDPSKILCIGLNYVDHARETGAAIPSEPVVFNKLPGALLHHGGIIRLPGVSRRVDYEAELVLVIGKQGRDIAEENALEHVAGYCCGNDVSARDWQKEKPAGQWFLGKTFDTFAPTGPYLVTADEIGDPGNLELTLRLNGRVMQHSNTNQFIFPIPKLIAYVSQVCTLTPGDLIFTGTPAGVGDSRKPPSYLQPGQTLEVEIERVGILRNRVERAQAGNGVPGVF